MSRSMQCSGDALANRLKLLLKSQKSGIDKRAELATLLKELTRCTSDSVIAEMTNSVVQVKDDTQLHVEFLNGMYANLVADKLTTSGKNAVLNVFTHHCENLTRVGIIDRAFKRLQDAETHKQLPTFAVAARHRDAMAWFSQTDAWLYEPNSQRIPNM